jgi:DNA replication protein DnaC
MKITHPRLQKAREAIYASCVLLARNPVRGRTCVLYGLNGVGKTHTMRCVRDWVNHTAQLMPMVVRADLDDAIGLASARYAHWPGVVDEFQKRQEIGIVDDLMHCNIALIDDIGAEHDPSGFGREQLYLILSRREFKWNFISTNFPPAEWHQKFDRRIASRLFRNAEHIDLSDVPDFSTI